MLVKVNFSINTEYSVTPTEKPGNPEATSRELPVGWGLTLKDLPATHAWLSSGGSPCTTWAGGASVPESPGDTDPAEQDPPGEGNCRR